MSTMTDRHNRDFLDCFPAIPFYRVGHFRLQPVQTISRTPADVVMLCGGASDVYRILRARPINHSDVLVSVRNSMNIEKPRSNQRARAGTCGGWAFAEERHF